MYKLPYYTEEDQEKVLAFMQANSFANVIGAGEDYPVATHVPLEIKETGGKISFSGHIMKNTDHHKAFSKNENVIVIFNGPHCYISASWYANPNVASTWNYIAVHAKGKIKFTDEEGTRAMVENITNKYEGMESDAAFNKLPGDYVNKLIKAIIGFSIEVESIDNVFKLSQNHEVETKLKIIKRLSDNGSNEENKIAEYMRSMI